MQGKDNIEFWPRLLAVYLHDPPDKALDIRGHVARAERNYTAVFGVSENLEAMKGQADSLSSRHERLPLPDHTAASSTIVGVSQDRTLRISHPLQQNTKVTLLDLPEPPAEQIAAIAGEISDDCQDPMQRFYAIWRLWKPRLEQNFEWIGRLPAETRAPDHTIWNHLDTCAAFAAAELRAGKSHSSRWGLLSFKLSPVQSFIEQARSTRDVFTGSFLLAWLVFQAMEPVLESYGPTAFVYPYLRETPLMDWWLKKQGVPGIPDSDVLRANYPNRFVALIADGEEDWAAQRMAEEVVKRCRAAWAKIASAVKEWLLLRDPFGNPDFAGWDINWADQIESFFSVQASFLPGSAIRQDDLRQTLAAFQANSLSTISPESAALAKISEKIETKGHDSVYQQQQGEWQFLIQLSALMMESFSRVKHVPSYVAQPDAEGKYPQKCTLLGSYEQMGPGDRGRNDSFWKRVQQNSGNRVREGEKLCAIALVKRLAFPAYFNSLLNLKSDDTRFPDTATLAATIWLKQAGFTEAELRNGDWNGQWLHENDREERSGDAAPPWVKKRVQTAKSNGLGSPPTYYAILLMDGDSLGDWLSARHPSSPTLEDAYAPQIQDYLQSIGLQDVLKSRRPVGPALHAAISEALGHFSTMIVPGIVDHFQGALIYAGGDDVLAFLPLENALSCALEIQKAYTGQTNVICEGDGSGWLTRKTGSGSARRSYLTMGCNAGISAGLAIVHYHEDLRVAFDYARAAERLAKRAKPSGQAKLGKNRLGIALAKRSGETLQVNCPWSFVPVLETYVTKFKNGATDAWARQVQREIGMWEALEAQSAGCLEMEVRRAIVRSEERRHFHADEVLQEMKTLRNGFATSDEGAAASNHPFGKGPYAEYLNLVHTASFLARGRDE